MRRFPLQRILRWPVLGLVLLSVPAVAAAGNGATVLARVDGEPVTTVDLDELLALQKRPSQPGADAPGLSADGLLTRLIQNRLLEQEGYRSEVHTNRQIRNQVWDLSRHQAMIALLDSVSADVPRTEPEEFGPTMDRVNVMFRVSHILVESEGEARALLDSLASGAAFAALAERHSRDSANADRGGDLGWGRSDLYIPEFREALEGLSEGDFAGPVQTDNGWHVLLLAETHTETVGQSAEMKEQLREAAIRERVMEKVAAYVESLKEKYDLYVDRELLSSLDFASSDPEVAAELRGSQAVLARLPWRELTVADLSRQVQFEHFHGLVGKPNAGELRDQVFDDWLTEMMLRHEAAELGFDRSPAIVAAADRMERRLVREHVVNELLDFPFEPTPEEIQRFYDAHPEEFTPVPRTRVAGAHLADEASALAFREALERGADVAWLAERAPGVVDPAPVIYADWIVAENLGSVAAPAAGEIVGPLERDGVWAVVEIRELESVTPAPLEECRREVVASMKRERMQEVLADALTRLEEASEIEILPDAHGVIDARLQQWLAAAPVGRVP